ncbi:hypothetical protein FAZ95_38985 [Trinickia violacea]|uniref:Uncharacterized protein n=1 Tax=Trinickia violacea TaxID=2571746 RepID=A0A4P8J2D7_9BURK|nr:hypothetical protein [Trinickia violacea]QCP55117.1 hypothetical protein FAZ95_38985 [Trinickia violacea]
MFLKDQERIALLNASLTPDELDRVISTVQQRNPHAFHTQESLHTRVFFNQPLHGEPCKGFIHFAPPQPGNR